MVREHDPNKIPCTDGGRAHVVPTEALASSHRIVCPECRVVFIRDENWAQGWRPAPQHMQEDVERLVAAETVVREQLDPDGERFTNWDGSTVGVQEAAMLQELQRLQRAVLGIAEGDPLP